MVIEGSGAFIEAARVPGIAKSKLVEAKSRIIQAREARRGPPVVRLQFVSLGQFTGT
jgi:hypothetical protein